MWKGPCFANKVYWKGLPEGWMCSKASFIVGGNIAARNNLVDNCIIIFILSDISILASNIDYEHGISAVGLGTPSAVGGHWCTQDCSSKFVFEIKSDQKSEIWIWTVSLSDVIWFDLKPIKSFFFSAMVGFFVLFILQAVNKEEQKRVFLCLWGLTVV